MKASDADRLLIEFAQLINAEKILVIGSQAIHATHPDPPIDVVTDSREIDAIPLPYEQFEKWFFYAHERLGSDSEFDLENQLYVDMVNVKVPKLPPDWEARCTHRTLNREDGTRVDVLYPDIYDLLLTKLLANRPQDEAFLRGVKQLQKLDGSLLATRLEAVELVEGTEHLRNWARKCIGRVFRKHHNA